MRENDFKSRRDYLLSSESSGDFSIIRIGFNDYNFIEPFLKWRILPFKALHYIYSGKGTLYIGEKQYALGPHQLFYIPSGVLCKYYPDPEDPFAYFWFDFEGNRAMDLLASSGISVDNPVIDCPEYVKFQNKLSELDNELQSSSLGYFSILSKVYKALDYIVSKENPAEEDNKELLVSRMKRIIEDCYQDESFNVETLCKMLYLSRSYTSRIFKEKTGDSLIDYIIKYRMEKANEFILKTSRSLKEIAGLCGYARYEYFLKQYKKYYGVNAGKIRLGKRETLS